MVSKILGIKTPSIDTSALDQQAADAKKRQKEADAEARKGMEEEATRRRALRRKQKGRFSLIAGSELGVEDGGDKTLGAS